MNDGRRVSARREKAATNRLSLVCIILIAGLSGCSGAGRFEMPGAGQTRAFEPGLPSFDLEAVATVRAGAAGLDVYVGVPHASLVFTPTPEGFAARYEALLRLHDARGKDVLSEVLVLDTVRTSGFAQTQQYDAHLYQRRLDLAPGTYLLEAILTDLESRQQAVRRVRVTVPALGGTQPALSALRLEARRSGRPFAPLLALNAPARFDSLRAVAELYNFDRLGEVEVTMHLLRLPSDTATARPPYHYALVSFGNLVRYDAPDTVQATRRVLTEAAPELVAEFSLPALAPGLYRIVVEAGAAGEASNRLRVARDVALRGPSFPRIETLGDMVAALVYIARERELAHIQSATTPAERKRRFDAFWGSLIPDRQRAANLLKRYYSRVEEANLRFTTYKEGWRTDRGMVYVVLGSPLYVETFGLDREVWHYSYDESDPLSTFIFVRRPLFGSNGLFEAYILEREFYHENAWRRALDRWRRGEML